MSGGDRNGEVTTLAIEIGKANRLSKFCTVKAAELANAAVRSEIGSFRPTARYLKMKEQQAVSNYKVSGCPERALVGISFGVFKIAREDLATRRIVARK